jgi:hypothetical protein
MASPGDLRLPKFPVVVELSLAGRGPISVEVFVAEHQATDYRRQHVLDLLESDTAFLPARQVDGDRFLVFNKAAAVWVGFPLTSGELPVEEAAEAPETELYESQHEVEVELSTGASLRGNVLYSLPPESARVADYLNQPGRFMRLWTVDRVYLINKAYVLSVAELAELDDGSVETQEH